MVGDRQRNAVVMAHEFASMGVGVGIGLGGETDQYRVAGRFEDRQVKFAIRDLEAHGIVDHVRLRLQHLAEPLQNRRFDLFRRTSGKLGLQQSARLDHGIVGEVRQPAKIETLALVDSHRPRTDAGARAMADLENAALGQKLEGAAHTVPADLEHGGEIALGRQFVAGVQQARRDQIGKAGGDLLTQRQPLDAIPKHRPEKRRRTGSRQTRQIRPSDQVV